MPVKEHLEIVKTVVQLVLDSDHRNSDTRRDFIIHAIQEITPDNVDPLIPELVSTIEEIINMSDSCCARIKQTLCCIG